MTKRLLWAVGACVALGALTTGCERVGSDGATAPQQGYLGRGARADDSVLGSRAMDASPQPGSAPQPLTTVMQGTNSGKGTNQWYPPEQVDEYLRVGLDAQARHPSTFDRDGYGGPGLGGEVRGTGGSGETTGDNPLPGTGP